VTTRRLYDRDMYRFDRPEPSYWEATASQGPPDCQPLEGDRQCEVAIVGGGYSGLSAAYHLARDYGIGATVLEAGHIGWGASGRNGGFCTIGGTAAELEDLLKRYGADEVRAWYRAQVDAVELVRSIATDEDIDADVTGDAELEAAHTPRAFASLKEYTRLQSEVLGLDAGTLTRDEFRDRYFDSTEQYGGAWCRPTFGIHPLRFHHGLARAAAGRGAILHPHSEVIAWERQGSNHRLVTPKGSVTARYVLFLTNGFMPEQLRPDFAARSLPLISAIVVTRPLTTDELAAYGWTTSNPAINSRRLLNYFRVLPDRRLLFGGRGHSSGDPQGSARNFERIVELLYHLWPEWRKVDIEYRWHGFVCFTRRLIPSIGRLPDDPSVFFGFGFHGNGVNTATWTGRLLAKWLGSARGSSDAAPGELPAFVRGLAPRFPLAALRLHYLQAAIAWYRFRDRYGLE